MPLLEYLSKLTVSEQKYLISGAPKELLLCLSEIALNLFHKNITLTKNQIQRLKKYEKQIIELASRKHSLKKRRAIIKGGKFLKTILDNTLPQVVLSIIKKKNGNIR